MDRGSDVFRTLRWGLRKYAWVVVLTTVAVGVVIPFVQAQQPDVYEATAEVTYDGELLVPNIDPLPRAGETVFNNGAVADGVRKVLGKRGSGGGVIPQKVELVAQQDNVVFTVIGRDGDPKTAQELANTAATIFALQMTQLPLAVNGFTQSTPAAKPTTPVATLTNGPVGLALAVMAGVIAGLGAVMLLLMRRQPVLDAVTASEVAGAPVLGKIRVPHRSVAPGEGPVGGIAPLARRMLAGRADLVMLAGPPAGSDERRRVSSALAEVLGQHRKVRLLRGGELDLSAAPASAAEAGTPELVIIDGPTPLEQAVRPETSMMLLVVPEGISMASLREAVNDHVDGDGTGVVLVRRDRRGKGLLSSGRGTNDRESDGPGEERDEGSFFGQLSDDGTRAESPAVAGETRSPVR